MWTSSMPSLQRKREVGPPNVEGLSPWVRSLAWRYFLSRKIVGAIETLIAWTGNSRVELQRPRRLTGLRGGCHTVRIIRRKISEYDREDTR